MAIVGVFDSGIGGLAVARAIEQAFPGDTVIYAADKEHMPYGDKLPEAVRGFVLPILRRLAEKGCEAIVIACNTVTTNHIDYLRARMDVPLVGMEPMVKPAAGQSRSGVIAVCATPATLASERYAWLKQQYARHLRVIEPDCRNWAYMIEHNHINKAQIDRQIKAVCDSGADVIVLGCTHYHWIEGAIRAAADGRAMVLQPEQPVIQRLCRVLGRG